MLVETPWICDDVPAREHDMRRWITYGALFIAGMTFSTRAHALSITAASCTQQVDNTLRFDCSVTTDGAADVWVGFCEHTGAACVYDRETPHVTLTAAGTATVTMYGMAESQAYDWRGVAKQGAVMAFGGRHSKTTGALPAEMADITLTTWGAASGVKNVMFNYSCEQGADPDHDWILIADTSGRVVWYQDPEDAMGSMTTLSALNISRPDKHILAVAGHSYILEYSLAGSLVKLYCRDDDTVAGDQCEDTSISPDAYFTDYVHHDVMKTGSILWALTAENQTVSDTDNCDGASATFPIIVDGVYGFNTSTDTLAEEWDLSEVYSPSYADATCTSCSASYWSGELTGCDWSHANSLWVDAAKQWTISLRDWSRIISIDGDPVSGTYRDLDWELEGSGVGGDFTLSSTPGYTATFSGQHAVMWTGSDTTLLYDNHTSTVGDDSRAIEIDWSSGDADIVNEYLMESSAGSNLSCQTGGTALDLLPSGHKFAFCTSNHTANDPLFNEFDASNSLVWGMKAECPAGVRTLSPSYRGYANLW
jgi:hypothetical protein